MKVKTTLAAAVLAALFLGLPASALANRTVTVEAGESIQDAIDAARPGTTIKIEEGTYNENLLIDKDGISLVGEGRKSTKIVYDESATPNPVCGAGDPPLPGGTPSVSGICVADINAQFEPQSTVSDVHISRLSVTGFSSIGIVFVGAEDISVKKTYLADNHEYGVAAFDSSDSVIAHNVTPRNGEAGIYVGDSEDADSTVYRNVAWGNLFGIFLRDASNGEIVKNKSFDNCVGILFLDTPSPTRNQNWIAHKNLVAANNRTSLPDPGPSPRPCGGEEEPPVSGVGIAIAGADRIRVVHNGVFGNGTPEGATSIASGGIVLLSLAFEGGTDATNAKVAFNTALGNDPDISWDGAGAGNQFIQNECLTSVPDGLCQNDAGDDHGDDEGDDHGDGKGHDRGDDRGEGGRKHHGHKHRKHKSGKKRSRRHARDD
jgi:parallel beta-helix repeat protein